MVRTHCRERHRRECWLVRTHYVRGRAGLYSRCPMNPTAASRSAAPRALGHAEPHQGPTEARLLHKATPSPPTATASISTAQACLLHKEESAAWSRRGKVFERPEPNVSSCAIHPVVDRSANPPLLGRLPQENVFKRLWKTIRIGTGEESMKVRARGACVILSGARRSG